MVKIKDPFSRMGVTFAGNIGHYYQDHKRYCPQKMILMNLFSRLLLPFVIVFIILSLLILAGWSFLINKGFDPIVLMGANGFFLLIALLVFMLQKKALFNPNPNVFIRSVMSGMMIKMGLCVAAVLVYTLSAGDSFNKKSVFVGLLLYLVYLAVEVRAITKLNKQHHG